MAVSALTATGKKVVYLAVSLSIFGLVMIASASVVTATRNFSDPLHFLKLQAGWTIVGLAAMVYFSKLKIEFLIKNAKSIYLFSAAMLAAVFIPGVGILVQGARRWIGLAGFSFQPAEVAKLGLIIYLSHLLSQSESKITSFLATVGIICSLVIVEPDLGTTLVLAVISGAMYIGSNRSLKPLLFLIPGFILATSILIITSPYRLDRLQTFLNISQDPLGSSYHIRQAILGLGGGGIFGRGLGQSRQKFEFLPEVTTDSILAVIGEELGLVGTGLTVAALLWLANTGLQISKRAPDLSLALIAVGVSSWIGFQTLLNVSALTALMPLTGIPLPFISYGGSSIIMLLASCGLLVNISRAS